jgi:hypothetical protein
MCDDPVGNHQLGPPLRWRDAAQDRLTLHWRVELLTTSEQSSACNGCYEVVAASLAMMLKVRNWM